MNLKKTKIGCCHAVFIGKLRLYSDETGEPVYYQNFNYIIREIRKDANGKYYRIKD